MEKEVGSPKVLFQSLDLTPIQSILWRDLHRQGPGRPVVYDPVWGLRALMLRQILQIPYVKDVVRRLRRDAHLRGMCRYGDRAPCHVQFSQVKSRLGPNGFHILESHLFREALRIREGQLWSPPLTCRSASTILLRSRGLRLFCLILLRSG